METFIALGDEIPSVIISLPKYSKITILLSKSKWQWLKWSNVIFVQKNLAFSQCKMLYAFLCSFVSLLGLFLYDFMWFIELRVCVCLWVWVGVPWYVRVCFGVWKWAVYEQYDFFHIGRYNPIFISADTDKKPIKIFLYRPIPIPITDITILLFMHFS